MAFGVKDILENGRLCINMHFRSWRERSSVHFDWLLLLPAFAVLLGVSSLVGCSAGNDTPPESIGSSASSASSTSSTASSTGSSTSATGSSSSSSSGDEARKYKCEPDKSRVGNFITAVVENPIDISPVLGGGCLIPYNIQYKCFCQAPLIPGGYNCPDGTTAQFLPTPPCSDVPALIEVWSCIRHEEDVDPCTKTKNPLNPYGFGSIDEENSIDCNDSEKVLAAVNKDLHSKEYLIDAIGCDQKCSDAKFPSNVDLGGGDYSCNPN